MYCTPIIHHLNHKISTTMSALSAPEKSLDGPLDTSQGAFKVLNVATELQNAIQEQTHDDDENHLSEPIPAEIHSDKDTPSLKPQSIKLNIENNKDVGPGRLILMKELIRFQIDDKDLKSDNYVDRSHTVLRLRDTILSSYSNRLKLLKQGVRFESFKDAKFFLFLHFFLKLGISVKADTITEDSTVEYYMKCVSCESTLALADHKYSSDPTADTDLKVELVYFENHHSCDSLSMKKVLKARVKKGLHHSDIKRKLGEYPNDKIELIDSAFNHYFEQIRSVFFNYFEKYSNGNDDDKQKIRKTEEFLRLFFLWTSPKFNFSNGNIGDLQETLLKVIDLNYIPSSKKYEVFDFTSFKTTLLTDLTLLSSGILNFEKTKLMKLIIFRNKDSLKFWKLPPLSQDSTFDLRALENFSEYYNSLESINDASFIKELESTFENSIKYVINECSSFICDTTSATTALSMFATLDTLKVVDFLGLDSEANIILANSSLDGIISSLENKIKKNLKNSGSKFNETTDHKDSSKKTSHTKSTPQSGMLHEITNGTTFDFKETDLVVNRCQKEVFPDLSNLPTEDVLGYTSQTPFNRGIYKLKLLADLHLKENNGLTSLESLGETLPFVYFHYKVEPQILEKVVNFGFESSELSTQYSRGTGVYKTLSMISARLIDGSYIPVSLMLSTKKESSFSWSLISTIFEDFYLSKTYQKGSQSKPKFIIISGMEENTMSALDVCFKEYQFENVQCEIYLKEKLKKMMDLKEYLKLNKTLTLMITSNDRKTVANSEKAIKKLIPNDQRDSIISSLRQTSRFYRKLDTFNSFTSSFMKGAQALPIIDNSLVVSVLNLLKYQEDKLDIVYSKYVSGVDADSPEQAIENHGAFIKEARIGITKNFIISQFFEIPGKVNLDLSWLVNDIIAKDQEGKHIEIDLKPRLNPVTLRRASLKIQSMFQRILNNSKDVPLNKKFFDSNEICNKDAHQLHVSIHQKYNYSFRSSFQSSQSEFKITNSSLFIKSLNIDCRTCIKETHGLDCPHALAFKNMIVETLCNSSHLSESEAVLLQSFKKYFKGLKEEIEESEFFRSKKYAVVDKVFQMIPHNITEELTKFLYIDERFKTIPSITGFKFESGLLDPTSMMLFVNQAENIIYRRNGNKFKSIINKLKKKITTSKTKRTRKSTETEKHGVKRRKVSL